MVDIRKLCICTPRQKMGLKSFLAIVMTTTALPVAAQTGSPSPSAGQAGQTGGTNATRQAQPAPTTQGQDQSGDIVVTSTRQSQVLSRVALSIVAKDQAALDKQGVRSIADIARVTPSITFGQSALYYGTGQSVIAIRGVQSDSGIPTTGVYIDDTPIQTRTGVSPSLTNAYPQVFDLERLEVLRGPQGTLFGTGSVGGAIRFITPDPSYDDVHVYARSEIAGTQNGAPSYEAGVAVGAPIVEDQLGFRASVWYRHDGGYLDRLERYSKRLVEKDINHQDSLSGRVALGWKVTDTLTLTPSLFFQRLSIADGSRYELATSDPASEQFRTSLSKLPESHHDTFYLPALKMNLDLGSMSLVSNSSYFTRTTDTVSDDTTLSLAVFGGYSGPFPAGFENYLSGTRSRTRQAAFTQELRLQNANPNDRFNWVAGLFYSNTTVRDVFNSFDPQLLDVLNLGQSLAGQPPFASIADAFGTGLYQGQYSNAARNTHRDKQYAAFAQIDYTIVPRLKVTVGLRYTHADYVYDGFIAGPLYATDGTSNRLNVKGDPVTPKVGLAFQANRDNLFYLNAAKGVRGSGISPPVGASCASDAAAIGFDPLSPQNVRPDTIWSYEAGTKNRLFGGRLTIDASVYHVDWKQVQTLFALPKCQLYTTLNLGNAKIDGFDVALGLRPARGLTLGASVSYTNARYTSNVPGPDGTTIRRAGEPLSGAPWSVQINGEYARKLDSAELYGRADFSYSSHNDKPLDLASPLVDPNLPRPPAWSQLDLRAGVRFDQLDLSLFVNNVTNSHPVLSLYHDSLDSVWYRAGTLRPRTIGFTATLRR